MLKTYKSPPLEIGYKSVKGAHHDYQDRILVDEKRLLFVVADGVTDSSFPKGKRGHGDGGFAACTVVDFIAREFDGDLKDSILRANRELIRTGIEGPNGGETTITAGFINGETLCVANVGDSPAYRLRNGRLYRIHTPDRGHFGGISQSLGYEDEIHVHQRTVSLRENDLVALASDGVLKILNRRDLSTALNPNSPMEEHVDALVRLAQERVLSYDDDKSLILIKVLSRE